MVPLTKDIIIAIDGYSSCGKSTFAKSIAEELDYLYIDSGAMYRAVTLAAIKEKIIHNNLVNESALPQFLERLVIEFRFDKETEVYQTFLNNKNVENEIRENAKVAGNVSIISTYRPVREKMVKLQRKIGENGRIVMDGRDIGTVVFPNAHIKIFMTADPRIRAQRRFDELVEKGIEVDFNEIFENIVERDRMDENRKESPLSKADDAIVLDNSYMTPTRQIEWFIELLVEKGLYKSI
jgi:CMP/dCMP kinase